MTIAAATALPRPLTLRGVTFDPPLFCAPMAGITHSAFRRLLSDFGGYGGLFTEMLAARSILKEDLQTSPWLKRRPQEGKLIYQLLVLDTRQLPEVIDRLGAVSPDGLDLNCACPAVGIRRRGGGSELFADPPRLRAIVAVMRKHFEGPLSVKIRLGRRGDDWRQRLRERLHTLEEEGVDAVTLHPRFSEESRNRPVRHQLYPEVAAETRLPIIASGDITDAGSLRAQDPALGSVAGLMIGRMAAVRPWVFAQWHDPELAVDYADVWSRMCDYVAEDFQPRAALVRIKYLAPYLARNFVFGHTLFKATQSSRSFDEARDRGIRFLAASPACRRHPSLDSV